MDTSAPTAPDKLCAEILAQAHEQAAEIIARARAEAARLLQEASAEAARFRDEHLAAASREVAHRRQLILATVPVELGRERSAIIEIQLKRIYEQVRQRLLTKEGFDYRATLVSLAAEAVGRMVGQGFVIKLAPEDRVVLGEELGPAVTERLGNSHLDLQIVEDPAISDGGLWVQGLSGFQICDNRLTARLDRLWPELRRQVATRLLWASENQGDGGAS